MAKKKKNDAKDYGAAYEVTDHTFDVIVVGAGGAGLAQRLCDVPRLD
jgi:hypothetical protein